MADHEKDAFFKGSEYVDFLEGEAVSQYVLYISYKAQRALFEICVDAAGQDGMRWDELADMMRRYRLLRSAARAVVRNAVTGFDPKLFDFTPGDKEPRFFEDGEEENYSMARLFTEEEGARIVQFLAYLTETEHFRSLNAKNPGFTWEEYVRGVMDGGLGGVLASAFQKAVIALDYKSGWLSDDIEETKPFRKAFLKTVESMKK